MRAVTVATTWVVFYFLLARYGVFLLPRELARHTTLPEYLAGVQAISILAGVGLTKLLSRTDPTCWSSVFPPLHRGHAPLLPWVVALLLAPLTYLVAHSLGMYLAYDTLIHELLTRGTQAVQKQTGELGRSATQDSLLVIVPFTLILAPLGEELLFRGAVFGGIQQLLQRTFTSIPTPSRDPVEPPESIQIAGLSPRENRAPRTVRLANWIVEGGGAALVSGAIFGLLHADTPGGLGIVRLVAALVLGFALGLVRKRSGGLVAPLLLHMGYNCISLATMRGWIVTSAYPTKYGIPTLLGPITGVCLAILFLLGVVLRRQLSVKDQGRTQL